MATVDHWATRMLKELVIDLAFLGANGISREHGLTTPDPAVAAVKAQVVASARRRIFVGVHTKFGVSSFCRFADLPDFEALVTDTGVSAADAHRYSVLGPPRGPRLAARPIIDQEAQATHRAQRSASPDKWR